MSGAARRAPLPGALGSSRSYTLERQLGRGGFGEVWLATHEGSGEAVAVKLLLPEVSEKDALMERFEREIRTGACLQHPHIAPVLDAGRDARTGRAWFAMSYCPGLPWDMAGLTLRGVLEVARQVLGALSWIHARGIVHRDLKPDNVLVEFTPEGVPRAQLLDFGIAFLADGVARRSPSTVTQVGAPMGTLAYMSPEQAAGEPSSVGPSSDLYSLGIVLFELVSGAKPFQGKGLGLLVKHCAHPPPPLRPSPLMPDPLPPEIEALIKRLLLKPYGERPEFAVELRSELSQLLERLQWMPWRHPEAQVQPARAATPLEVVAPPAEDPVSVGNAPTVVSHGVSAVERAPRVVPASAREVQLLPGAQLDGERTSLLRLRPSPLVGREAEQRAVQQAVQQVLRARAPRVVAISGPAGVGKTALGAWIAEIVHQHGIMRTLEVSLVDHGELRAALRAALYRQLRLPTLERRPLLERIGQGLELRGDAAMRLVDFMLGDTERAGAMDADALRQLGADLLQQLSAAPSPRPLLVWLDGAGTSAEASEEVARWLDAASQLQVPVLLLWTAERAAPPRSAQGTWETVALRGLASEALRALVAAILPELHEDGCALLHRQASGNPMVARELLLGWVERGLLQPSPEGWSPAVHVTTLPSQSPEQVLHVQLSALVARQDDPAQAAWALEVLSFLGPLFPPEQATQVLQRSGLEVEALIRQGVLAARPSSREARVAFASARAQGVLQGWSQEAGRAEQARLAAVDARIEGAVEALIRGAWDTVEQSLTMALATLQEGAIPPEDGRYLTLMELLAKIYYRRKEAGLVMLWAERMQAHARRCQPSQLSRRFELCAVFLRSLSLFISQDFDGVVALLGVEHLNARKEGELLREGQMLHLLAGVDSKRGQLDAASRQAQAAYEAYRGGAKGSAGYALRLLRLDEADVVSLMAQVRQLQGDLQGASALQRRILQIYREVRDPQGEAHALMALARSVRTLGDAGEARRLLRRAQDILGALDDRLGLGYLAWEQAATALQEARHADAEAIFLEAQQLFTTVGDEATAGMCANGRGEAARKAGRLAEADGYYRQFFEVMQRVGYVHGQALALMNMGWTRVEALQLDAAWGCFKEAKALLGAETPRTYRLMARIGLSLSELLRGDASASLASLVEAESVAEGHKVTDEDCQAALRRLSTEAAGPLSVHLRQRALRLLGEAPAP